MNDLEKICWKISDYADEVDNNIDLAEDLEAIVEYCKSIAYERGINLD